MDLESAYNCGAELEACLPSTSRTEVKAAVQRHAASSFAAADVSELTAQLIEVREGLGQLNRLSSACDSRTRTRRSWCAYTVQ